MFDRSTLACLVTSFVLVAGIFLMAWDAVSNVREYLNPTDHTDYATCLYEDGSAPNQSFPCYWDASLQGNGLGQSFVLHSPTNIEFIFDN
jgi:hypothetical protein